MSKKLTSEINKISKLNLPILRISIPYIFYVKLKMVDKLGETESRWFCISEQLHDKIMQEANKNEHGK